MKKKKSDEKKLKKIENHVKNRFNASADETAEASTRIGKL